MGGAYIQSKSRLRDDWGSACFICRGSFTISEYLFCLPLIMDALCEVLINLQGFQYEFPNFFTLLDLYFFDGREKFPV
jgi:hypothetical protein